MNQLELIYAAIISAVPALTAILGVVVACLRIVKGFKDVVKKGEDANATLKDENEMLKIALSTSIKETNELKKVQRKLLANLEHIDEEDLEV